MQIYIMRHGQAEMMANSDSERNLTDEGRHESEIMAKYLVKQDVKFDAVLVSPYIRAQQTWQSVSPFFEGISNIQVLPCLTPAGSARKSVDEILALQAEGIQSVLLVSHLPLVGYIVGELVPSAGVPAFSTSAVGHISLNDEDGFAELVSLTTVSQIID
ncbi:phosphohistidine phosphatase SixA [Psychromonas sp. 14N.309.X.WAT.B.A12]|uniref:phosphohistidine phosphatase SixA n=1 Tax=unclassified Psychromonas TaxID=2614957 RepID=UPI0025B0D8E4|nr:phosphohistidine phosphatase SixA [Psychromonas sp. 14N.309.X.WAT.B.A12]MDN2662523.1 phosphohistidine phosphatase SixA [Psychromonas sp. 14N.309.X.WAT.B.A12]